MKNKALQVTLLVGLITIFGYFVFKIPEKLTIGRYSIYLKTMIVGIWVTIILAILTLLAFIMVCIKENRGDKKGTKKFEEISGNLFEQTLLVFGWFVFITISANISPYLALWLKNMPFDALNVVFFFVVLIILVKIASKWGIPFSEDKKEKQLK